MSTTQPASPSAAGPARTSEPGPTPSCPAEDAPSLAAQLRNPGRYRILDEHGRGGIGRVSRARDRELGRDVAIKELISRGHLSEARFQRGALITARLEHPGIVSIHEAGRWPDGTPFYVMKLVAGRSLRDLLAERKTVDERIALLHHVIAVADAIAYAHGRDIIHRDLKPANVIVGDFGETVVIDWGLAKDLTAAEDPTALVGPFLLTRNDDLTATGAVLGTPAYMPPEQRRGEPVDQRADVFAIGAMLWELCALERTPPASAAQRRRTLRRAGIDGDLVTIIDKAVDPAPARRYADAGALAADLKAFKSGARIAARRYSLFAMLAHWTRRHRTLAVSVLAAVALAASGVVLYVRNIATERDRADAALASARRERDRARLSETSLLLEKDPTRAKEMLALLELRSPEIALLTSRARQLAAERVIAVSADLDGLYRLPGSTTVELVTRDGGFNRMDPVSGVLEPVDSELIGPVTSRAGQWLYAKKPFGASSITIASRARANRFDAELTSVSRIVAQNDAIYVLDAADDLHRIDGKTQTVVAHGVHNIAGNGDVRIVCNTSGELEVLRRDEVILRRRCPATKSPETMAVVGDDYAALTEGWTLLASRRGRNLEMPTPIRGDYELAMSREGVIAVADYSPNGTTWFVRPDGTSLEAGPSQAAPPYTVAADGNLAAWGYTDGTVIAIDTTTGMIWKLRGHSGSVAYIVIDAAHSRLVSGGRRELRVWDLKQPASTLIKAMPSPLVDAIPSPDGKQVALDCLDGSVWTWTRDIGAVTQIQHHVGMSHGVQWVKGMICSSGWIDGSVLCSAPDGSNPRTIDSGASRISRMTASVNHDYLVFASTDGRVWRYDGTLQELYSHNTLPERMAISPDGRMLASSALDGSFAVFDFRNHRLVTHLTGHIGAAYDVAWLGDELWTAGDDGALKRWGFRNGAVTLRHRLQAPGAVHRLRVAHGGWAAISGEGTVLVSRDGDSISLMLDLGRTIEALDVSSDLRYVAAATMGELVVVDLQDNRLATLVTDSQLTGYAGFVDARSLAVSATTGLKLVHVDDLDYIPF